MDSPRDTEPATDTIDAIDETRSRRELLRSGGVAALAGMLGVLGIATTAGAKNGSSVKLGEKNTATKPTTIESKKGPALQARTTSGKDPIGVRGAATAEKGVGVQGAALSGKGKTIGIQGLTASASGTAGQFVAEKGGTAIDAQAPKDGVALRTKGRIELTERSGSASVSEGGSEFVIPVSGGLSERSLVIATLQEHRPGVHVEAAYVLDAEEGRIVVRLNQAVAEQTKVAWLVLD